MNFIEKLAEKFEQFKDARKGNMGIDSLIGFAVGVVFLASISGVGAIVLDALNTSTSNTQANTIIGYGLTSISNLGAQLGTIGTVVGVIFLLTIVMGALGGALNKGGVGGQGGL